MDHYTKAVFPENPNSQWVKFQPEVEWIDINAKRPKNGEIILCKINVWEHGQLDHTEEIKTKYIGRDQTTGHQIFNIVAKAETFSEVTFWRSIKK